LGRKGEFALMHANLTLGDPTGGRRVRKHEVEEEEEEEEWGKTLKGRAMWQ